MSRLFGMAIMVSVLSFQSYAQVSRSAHIKSTIVKYKKAPESVFAITLTLRKISDGIARLDWTPQGDTCVLIRTDADGISIIIYTGLATIFFDTITHPYCTSAQLFYNVHIKDVSGSESNTESSYFFDANLPIDPILDNISIDSLGHPVISWMASLSKDVVRYKIQQLSPDDKWLPVGSANGNQTSFIADTMYACNGVKTFAVLAIDSCGNTSTGENAYPNALNTLMISGPPLVDECKGTAIFTWNSYNNMTPPLGGYRILRKEGTKPETLIGSTNPGVTTYTDTLGFISGVTYGYKVQAVSSDGTKTSTSCLKVFTSARPPRTNVLSINYVTVINSQYVEMRMRFSPPGSVKTIRVLRSLTANGNFETINSFSPGKNDTIISDKTAEVDQRSYYYKIEAIDECDITITSTVARTIFLTCQPNNDESNLLNWNAYEGWRSGIYNYEVYRKVNDDPFILIDTIPAETTTYTDFPPASQQGGDIISYYVLAVEGSIIAHFTPGKSVSNIVRAIRPPLVMMPNAIAPHGINNKFGPKMKYVANSGYQMLIFNKWGQQIFESPDPAIEWDGKLNGEFVPVDIYFYHLRYSSLTGDSFTKTGSLILVR